MIGEETFQYDALSRRLDGHGVALRDMGMKIDQGFLLLAEKLDHLNAKLTIEDRLLSERVTKLESERGLVGKVLAILAGGGAGLFSGWVGKHL